MHVMPKKYRSILCLHGDISPGVLTFLNIPVIAADGAVNFLQEKGVIPDYVIGDLDSISAPFDYVAAFSWMVTSE